jgi:hypothetical protein
VWLRRTPADLLLDATLGESGDPLIDALALLEAHAVPGMGLVVFALLALGAIHLVLGARPGSHAPARKAGDVALGVVVEGREEDVALGLVEALLDLPAEGLDGAEGLCG